MSPWIVLILAGLLEVAWVVGLKYTEGFTRLIPSLFTAASMAVSMYLLSVAVRTLPIGTSYGVWVGIGAVGAGVVGIVLFNEPATPLRLFFITLLVISLVGMKVTSSY